MNITNKRLNYLYTVGSMMRTLNYLYTVGSMMRTRTSSEFGWHDMVLPMSHMAISFGRRSIEIEHIRNVMLIEL